MNRNRRNKRRANFGRPAYRLVIRIDTSRIVAAIAAQRRMLAEMAKTVRPAMERMARAAQDFADVMRRTELDFSELSALLARAAASENRPVEAWENEGGAL